MSTETNIGIARRWIEEVWNDGQLSLIDELIAPGYVLHDPTRPGLHGREGIRESIVGFRTAFPDMRFQIENQLAEHDRVVLRYTVRGTHLGAFMGIPATGRSGTVTGIDIYRIADDKIEEAWSNWDALGLLQQIGVVPPMR